MPAITYQPSRIQALREGLGLTREEFAARLGVTRQAVAKWETGQAKPTVTTIEKIANEFGVKIDTFWMAREGK